MEMMLKMKELELNAAARQATPKEEETAESKKKK
jgi:hypothetical protein